MCAENRKERAFISQTKSLPSSAGILIFASKYPVCLRDASGHFHLCNSAFYKKMDCSLREEEHWFSHLSLDVQLHLMKAEIEAQSSDSGVCEIDLVTINNIDWIVYIDSISWDDKYYFVWRFMAVSDLNILFLDRPGNKNTPCGILLSEVYDDILPYLFGFSHKHSVALTKTTISSSKKKVMKFFGETDLKGRDDFLTYILLSGQVFYFYQKLKKQLEE